MKTRKITGLERHLQAACTLLTLNKEIRLLPPTLLPSRVSELSGNPHGLDKSSPLHRQDAAYLAVLTAPISFVWRSLFITGNKSLKTNPLAAAFSSDNQREVQWSQWGWDVKGIRMPAWILFDPQVLPICCWSEESCDTFTKLNGTIFEAAAICLGGTGGYFCWEVIG